MNTGPQLFGASGSDAEARRQNFAVHGPRLNVILRSPRADSGNGFRMVQREGLIDTGATGVVIDKRAARQLDLDPVNVISMGVVGGRVEAVVYAGILEVPELVFSELTQLFAISGSPTLLGRSFLAHFQMTYDGPGGIFYFVPKSYKPLLPPDDE